MAWSDRAGWFAIDGTEIVNSMRMAAYAHRAGCTQMPSGICMPCPDLFREVSTPPYIDPVSDRAPWYDPGRPESALFYGVAGLDINGIASQSDTEDNGRRVRDVDFTVFLAGADEMSLSYGLSWLSAALAGSFCASGGCTGSTACIAVGCPTPLAPDPVRTLLDVQVVDRPEVTEVLRMTGYVMWRVEFTLRAANPWLYQDPTPGQVMTIFPSGGVSRIIELPVVYELCQDPVPCGQDPECPRPQIPVVPQPPLDACYPAAPFPGRRVVGSIAPANMSTWLDQVPVVTIRTADLPMRNITVRFYVNALGLECDQVLQLDPCSACSDITISYLPPNSTTEIDGRLRRALTRCASPSGEDVDVPPLYGPGGQMFAWPDFSCGYGLCVEVTTHESVSPDATIDIALHTRQEAA